MGFALWIERDLAVAQGTHEYRPMGVGIVAISDLFGPRDFSPRRRPPARTTNSFVGYFASLGDLNAHLERRRSGRYKARTGRNRALPFL